MPNSMIATASVLLASRFSISDLFSNAASSEQAVKTEHGACDHQSHGNIQRQDQSAAEDRAGLPFGNMVFYSVGTRKEHISLRETVKSKREERDQTGCLSRDHAVCAVEAICCRADDQSRFSSSVDSGLSMIACFSAITALAASILP